MSGMALSGRERAVRDAAALYLAPVTPTAEMRARLAELVGTHELGTADILGAPVRVVELGQVRDTDVVVTVQTDGSVVRSRVRAVEARGGRVVVRFGQRGLSAVNGPAGDGLLVERDGG